jgi:hypothetical protein
MKERIPGASLTVYDRATHYLPIEFPARLASDMTRFMSANAGAGFN